MQRGKNLNKTIFSEFNLKLEQRNTGLGENESKQNGEPNWSNTHCAEVYADVTRCFKMWFFPYSQNATEKEIRALKTKSIIFIEQ